MFDVAGLSDGLLVALLSRDFIVAADNLLVLHSDGYTHTRNM